ncbi:MAG: hypothetical protein V2G42_07785 [bacterium JZ-2024 1]
MKTPRHGQRRKRKLRIRFNRAFFVLPILAFTSLLANGSLPVATVIYHFCR